MTKSTKETFKEAMSELKRDGIMKSYQNSYDELVTEALKEKNPVVAKLYRNFFKYTWAYNVGFLALIGLIIWFFIWIF